MTLPVTGRERLVAVVCAAAVLIVLARSAGGQAPSTQVVTDGGREAFVARVEAYVALRERVEASLPPFEETKDPAKLTDRQRAIATAVIAAREGVPEGAVFGDAAPILIRIVRTDFARRSAADRRALVQDLPKGARVAANAEYPDGLPLVTVPPALLRVLPVLPADIEYRIVGRDLVLLDTVAGLVVDVLRGAVPV